nr:hypothetical protein [Tanacetum cinerariifolium]
LRYEVGESSSTAAAKPTGGFRVNYSFIATLDDEIRRDPEREVGYGITDTWDKMLVDMPGAPATDEIDLGQRMTNFVTTVRQDTDRRDHARTARLMETEARLSSQAWVQSMDASDLTRFEVMTLRTQEDEDEDEEHPASADSIPLPPVHRVTAMMSIRE